MTRREFQKMRKQQKRVPGSRFHYIFFNFIIPIVFITGFSFLGDRFGINYEVQLCIVVLFAFIYGLVTAKLRGR